MKLHINFTHVWGFFWSLAAKNNEIDDHGSTKTHRCGNTIDHDMDDMDSRLIGVSVVGATINRAALRVNSLQPW